MMIKLLLKIVLIVFASFFLLIGYNNKEINCLIENSLPTKFIGIPSITWVRFVHPDYAFSFSYPACWKVDVQNIPGLDFIDVSKWIRGNLYSIQIMQSSVPDANQNPYSKISTTIGKYKIKASYSTHPNNFTGSSGGRIEQVGEGYNKVYSFQVDKDKYVSIQYIYEQRVNGKKYTEPEIGRVVADTLVQSVIIEKYPIWKLVSQYCPKCLR